MYSVQVNDYHQWRKIARALLQRGVVPSEIVWETSLQKSLFSVTPEQDYHSLPIRYTKLTMPSRFYPLAENVSCFRKQRKWSLLYRVAWRLAFENRRLLSCPVDEDVYELLSIQKAVCRDRHKMAAFVRFKRIACPDSANMPKSFGENEKDSDHRVENYLAWFEPDHLIVPSKAPFFVKRFHNMCWSILTPDICAHWDLEQLHFTEGLKERPKIEDELDKLWLTYYKHIFNPARLKLKAMRSEMPKKYWVNLPEAVLIPDLTRNAQSQTEAMINQKNTSGWNKTTRSRFIRGFRQTL